MRVEILGRERRRRWDDETKLGIVLSVGVDGATVTDVAHRHDVTRQQIYSWRSALKRKGALSPATIFMPVEIAETQETIAASLPAMSAPPSPPIELRLNCGRSLCFDGGIDSGVLTRLIGVVESA